VSRRRPVACAVVLASQRTVTGTARVGHRTKELTKRLEPGDIAVIDHLDLDRVAAEGLVAAKVVAVVNGAASVSGRYPNVGPMLLAAAGIMIVDGVGSGALADVADGATATVSDGEVSVDGHVVARGTEQTMETLGVLVESAKASIGAELARFAENTVEYIRAEQYLLLESPDVPDITTKIEGRHVLIVVRGDQFKEDLAALRSYIRDMKPVCIGVDGGADALLAAGHTPHIIVGDFDSVSTGSLRCGAELIVHAYADGRAPGAKRLADEGLSYATFALQGTSEDIAMLLAYEKGAELIVAVGTHVNLVDFLDKGRPGMASTFLTRLKVGPALVDAKGVNKLYQPRVRTADLIMLVVVGLAALVVLAILTPGLNVFLRALWTSWFR
jgi:uncharacterized membrane-anchored protein